MRLLLITLLVITYHFLIGQNIYVEANSGLCAPLSTTIHQQSVFPNQNVMGREPFASILLGYKVKNTDLFTNLSVGYGHLSNMWYFNDYSKVFQLGKPFTITNKYSIFQIGLQLGRRHTFHQSYFWEYKAGLSCNFLLNDNLGMRLGFPLTELVIPTKDGDIIYKYASYIIGYNSTNISSTVGMQIGKTFGKKQQFEVSLSGGANFGIRPLIVMTNRGNYTGKGLETTSILSVIGVLSVSNGSYLYLTPAIRCYF